MITPRERRMLAILYPGHSVAIGLSVFAGLRRKGLVRVDQRKWRYVLTAAGKMEVERHGVMR